MGVRRRLRGRVAAGAAAVAVLLGGAVALAVVSGPPVVSVRDVRIPVVDGPLGDQHVLLDATFFTPPGHGRVPAVLLAHGLGETKNAVRAQAGKLAQAGFAVLTWSARGFGTSTGQVALDSPDYEVKDVEQLVTWLAGQPRVRLDGPGDPRAGIAGASYGGAIALLAAGYDARIDAIVPQITWNDLATALFPNAAGPAGQPGVFKRQWAGLLFAQGGTGFGPAGRPAARATVCGRFIPPVCAAYQQVATAGRPTGQVISLLERDSPASVAGRIRVPTLLIQGLNDSLFGLDQADANYAAIERTGAPVDMVWFDGGHDGGNQETSRIDGLVTQWFDRWLTGSPPRRGGAGSSRAASGQPGFAVTRALGFDPSSGQQSFGIATASGYPGLHGSGHTVVRLAGPPQTVVNPPGGSPPSMSVFPGIGPLGSAGARGGGLAFDMPGQSATFVSAPLAAPIQVTGAPTVTVRVGGAAEVTLFGKLYDVDQGGHATLPYQLAGPLRVQDASAGQVVNIQLPAIDYRFAAGHRLRLALTSTDFAYATPAAAASYQVALVGTGVRLPSDAALAIRGSGVPWWTWAGPATAVVVALLLLTLGRPGRPEAPLPDLADVPLEITGLTKRYRDGQLAVDDLSLRVRRGQILGLLGPNGAGKTTTLRALMGLIHPDAGVIAIFGQRVRPGAAVLSRLGSFVEGPGFLPHLSGRANLELYWRATGRPAADSRMPEMVAIAGLGAALDRPVRTYSRGMCQRLAIAQAMLGTPDLLVLDEPMNGLDPPQIREMREVLLRYASGGRAVILSSHMLAEVEQTCGVVVVMNLGRRIAAGPVSEIIGDGAALVVGTQEADRALAVLRDIGGIERAEAHPDGVLVHRDGVAAATVVAALVRAGVPVDRVTPNRRLEDAFLALIPGHQVTADAGVADQTVTPDAGAGPAGGSRRHAGPGESP
jgi:ABC-2 type transport system ATP-binding protein